MVMVSVQSRRVGFCVGEFGVFGGSGSVRDKLNPGGNFYGGVFDAVDTSVGGGKVVRRGEIEEEGVGAYIRGDREGGRGSDRGGGEHEFFFFHGVARGGAVEEGEVCYKIQPKKQELAAADDQSGNVAFVSSRDGEGGLLIFWDFKNEYRHFQLQPDVVDYFVFRYNGIFWRRIVLPFEWGQSVHYFRKLLQLLLRQMRERFG